MKGSVYTTEDFKPKDDYYYIINLTNLFKPIILPVYFVNKVAANRAIKTNVPKLQERKKYSVIRGNKLKVMDMKYRIAEGVMRFFSKYDYEPNMTRRERMRIRQSHRRRLRRMNLYAKIKVKKHIKEPVKQVKYIKNTQKVSTSPKTKAKAFTIERKGLNWVYIVLKSGLTKRTGKLFRIYALRINLKQGGRFKRKWIYTQRNDILHPLLITQVIELIKGKEYEKELKAAIWQRLKLYFK